ncbi:hypothetical protein AGR1B_pAt30042 [Agrobacterium fabacearum S56]|uniref:toll/interleukin-1 receptor domain-containing protein n=1 Tax=Agrobacterium tumefaciens TaxID=358 RepID=UPI0009BA3FE1|nr:toll/interleukin-1 receptor domain-containing protein [Agrobacterium tumefaciens]CUX05347.1 hypothetical protein AGR1B_pAt30042 [Agrobacterium fabacearum S56]
MKFNWSEANPEIFERFKPETNGYEQWQSFLELLSAPLSTLVSDETGLPTDLLILAGEALSKFDLTANSTVQTPTVFVSHRQFDLKFAERVAWLACDAGMDYWLDVHDPFLKYANHNIPRANPLYPILVAGIIEMALLNSSHLIAIHTRASRRSQWIPYEFGRLRDRKHLSSNCGSWFDPRTNLTLHGDYLRLARKTQGGETDVRHWLQHWSGSAAPLYWGGPATHPLPN